MLQAALEATQACLAEALQRLSDAQQAAVIDAMRTLRPWFT
jgi:hypothetical protein